MLFDSHLHTRYSEDSQTRLKDYIFRAAGLDLGITVTDHYDIVNPGPHAHVPGVPDCTAMLEEYRPLRSRNLLVGIELGLERGVCAENKAIAENFEWDYILGSLHVLDGMNIYFFDHMCGGRAQQEIYNHYFSVFTDTVRESPFIHAVGHIDHICRYNSFAEKNLSLEKYGDSMDKLFRLMVERELAIEINTKRFAEPGAEQSLLPVLRRFAELGGRYFTAGSDAHNVAMLGFRLQEAYEMGRTAGLSAVVFRNGKKEYI